jgi:hypothetical protein
MARYGRGAWIILFAALGCGGSETKHERHGTDEQEVDPERAEQLMKQAQGKMKANAFAEARTLLRDAYRYSDAAIRHQIGLANDDLDEAQAAHVAEEVGALVKQDKCGEALKTAAATVETTQETGVPTLLSQKAGDGLEKCVSGLISAGKLAEARKLYAAPETKKALDGGRYGKLGKQLEDTVMEKLLEKVGEAMSARRWPEVTSALHQAVKDGSAGPKHREKLLATVRQGIAEDVEKIVGESFGESKGATDALTRVDALLAAGFWKPRPPPAGNAVDAETARLQKLLEPKSEEKPAATKPGDEPTQVIPEKLDKLRRELAFWVGCDAIKCKPSDVTQMWTYGNAPVHPTLTPRTAGAEKIPTGKRVWRIAEGGNVSLVAIKDPGSLADLKARAHAGVGWVQTSALKPQDTSEWLPPGDSIIGTRVWAQLREATTDLEIGKVIAVDGANVNVQRLSDQAVMSVARNKVHFGLTKKGTKVLALCATGNLGPALIEKVIEPKHESLGDPRAVLRCLDDKGNPASKTREDPLGAIRTKREWLPAPK